VLQQLNIILNLSLRSKPPWMPACLNYFIVSLRWSNSIIVRSVVAGLQLQRDRLPLILTAVDGCVPSVDLAF
jgi:hypothetical protein